MKARRIQFFVLGLGAAAAIAGYAMWPRQPRLVRYTSPLINVDGRTVRLEVLVPEGWRVDPGYRPPTTGPYYVVLSPGPEQLDWMHGWLRRLFPRPPEARADIMLLCRRTLGGKDEAVHASDHAMRTDRWLTGRRAYRNVKAGSIYSIQYHRTDHTAFEATYRQICDSFRVIR